MKTKGPRQEDNRYEDADRTQDTGSGKTPERGYGGICARRTESESGGQSGDLQGLSNIEGADSESVAELIEEGNAFEADAVTGVEDAGDTEEKEVRTHEVPQDDVPGEYLDKE